MVALALFYALLLIPDRNAVPRGAGKVPFEWKRDAWWTALEQRFTAARQIGCEATSATIGPALAQLRESSRILSEQKLKPTHAIFAEIETNLFQLATSIAACPRALPDYSTAINTLRDAVKHQSRDWDLSDAAARQTLYRLLLGSRMAHEQVLLQVPGLQDSTVHSSAVDDASGTAIRILGLSLRSGDIFLSRGGAATSAMIARANDFPGSFSHVALLHVDPQTGTGSVVESLSEKGVVVTPVGDFVKDKKLRILVLRPRADLPALVRDPLLPHRVATEALASARRSHIPYDFALNDQDHSRQFCSEVAAAAYEKHGLQLWTGLTYISLPAAIGWLGSLGVEHFETKEPSDLEYDPQLQIVGEWREPATLWKAHLDDAVTDVMLESAPAGAPLSYNRWLLPVARMMKLYSVIANRLGKTGPIPEGMSATVALRVDRYQIRHAELVTRLDQLAQNFRTQKGYAPPYWEMVRLGHQAMNAAGRD